MTRPDLRLRDGDWWKVGSQWSDMVISDLYLHDWI